MLCNLQTCKKILLLFVLIPFIIFIKLYALLIFYLNIQTIICTMKLIIKYVTTGSALLEAETKVVTLGFPEPDPVHTGVGKWRI